MTSEKPKNVWKLIDEIGISITNAMTSMPKLHLASIESIHEKRNIQMTLLSTKKLINELKRTLIEANMKRR
jgi:hypothetical protein